MTELLSGPDREKICDKLLKAYDELSKVYESKLHEWMKLQYSDVCSDGDVIINGILDNLNKKKKTELTDCELVHVLHIYETYLYHYLESEKPDPLWAD